MPKYKIEHNRPNCIGCGACVSTCPDFWEMSPDGKSTLKGSKQSRVNKDWSELEIDQNDYDCNKRAADACPVNVIHMTNLETKEKVI